MVFVYLPHAFCADIVFEVPLGWKGSKEGLKPLNYSYGNFLLLLRQRKLAPLFLVSLVAMNELSCSAELKTTHGRRRLCCGR